MRARKISISLMPGGYALTIAFFAAKVLGYVSWSWWLVFAPLWVPIALFIAGLLIMAVAALAVMVGVLGTVMVVEGIAWLRRKRRR